MKGFLCGLVVVHLLSPLLAGAETNMVGARIPPCVLIRPDGTYVHLAKQFAEPKLGMATNRVNGAVLNFMNLDCLPCRKELPLLLKTLRALPAPGLRLYVVSTDSLRRKEEVRAYLVTQGVDVASEVLLDPYRVSAQRFGVKTMPQTFLISGDGRITGHIAGMVADYTNRLAVEMEMVLRPLSSQRHWDK